MSFWDKFFGKNKEAIHPAPTSSRGQGSGVDVPPGFEADIAEVQRLQTQIQQNPQVIERLIKVYERILTRRLPDFFRASIQIELGVAYAELLMGDREANLRQAIACFQQALRFYTPKTAPLEYAITQNNLGNAYADLPTGDRGANLAQAIACYEKALRFYTPQTAPFDYAMTQNNLGEAYRKMPTGDRGANLRQAIACFQQALRFWTPEIAPFDYARSQHNLGAAYTDLPTGDRRANLERAINCYQKALRFWTPEAAPFDYAKTQNGLGTAYTDLPTGDRGANLERAINCYQQALRFWTPEVAPFDYAGTQNNLGTAYADLPTGDRGANLEQAIACYQQALRFWTPEATPFDYARTQTNLGNAYINLPTGDREANLERAIKCYRQALTSRTLTTAPFYYAITQNNLGTAYAEQPTGNRVENLKQAMACFEEALRFWRPETAPLHYAMTQTNLGAAYLKLPAKDRGANLEHAIGCFQKALRCYKPETAPFHYAMTQNNLGTAYADLPTGDRGSNLERAIGCFQEALRFWTLEIAPSDCRLTNRNLANFYFSQQDWDRALTAYRAAMEAGELLYRAGLSTESKAAEVAENAYLYRQAAFTAARLGNTAEALLILERGKTRLLAEALRLRVPRPTGVPDETWNAFEIAGMAVRAVQVRDNVLSGEARDLVRAYHDRIQNAKAADAGLDAAIKLVRVHAPNFLNEIDLPSIQALIPDEHTVLVAFCITDQGSMVFVLSHGSSESVQMIEVPGFTQADLANLLMERDTGGKPNGGWLGDYWSGDQSRWQRTIDQVLMQVGKQLIAPVVAKLPAGIQKLILLPAGGLFLLPLHAVPLSDGDSDRLCDRYQISYAPSAEVLADSRAKAMRASGNALYAVINPPADPPLIFTLVEGTAIADLFTTPQVHEGRAGTKKAVMAGLHGRNYLHFSCHGSYKWNDPPESGLDLADGRLTLAELQSGMVDLSAARLVTLSACETGISDVLRGSAEEYVGLPAGFMLAGVPCVVSSLWSVLDDISTALLMERFYRNHLKDRMDFPAALQEAQTWVRRLEVREVVEYAEACYQQFKATQQAQLLKRRNYYHSQAETNPTAKPFAHPYYWGAFTVNGM